MIKTMDFFRENRNLWIILLLGFLVRLIAFYQTHMINPDGVYYLFQAKAVSNGMWDSAVTCGFPYVSPYPVAVALFQKVFNDWIIASKAVSIFFGTISIIPLYFLLKRFFSLTVTGITMLLFAFNPFFVLTSVDLIKGPIFWFFSILAIFLFVKAVDSQKGSCLLLSCIVCGLAAMTRTEGLVLFPAAIIFLLFRKERTLKSLLYFSLPIILITLFVAGSLLLADNSQSLWTHHIKPKLEFHMSLINNPFDNAMTEKLKALDTEAIEHIPPGFFSKIKNMLWVNALGMVLTVTARAFYVPYFILFILGLYGVRREVRNNPLVGYILLLIALSFLAVYSHVLNTWFLEKRYASLLVMSSFVIMGLGVTRVLTYFKERGIKDTLAVTIICTLIVLTALPSDLKHRRKGKAVYGEIAKFITDREGIVSPRIATSEKRIITYANLSAPEPLCPDPLIPYRDLSQMKYGDLIRLLRDRKMDFFIWEESYWKNSPVEVPSAVDNNDMIELGQWKIKNRKLILYRVLYDT